MGEMGEEVGVTGGVEVGVRVRESVGSEEEGGGGVRVGGEGNGELVCKGGESVWVGVREKARDLVEEDDVEGEGVGVSPSSHGGVGDRRGVALLRELALGRECVLKGVRVRICSREKAGGAEPPTVMVPREEEEEVEDVVGD